MSVVVIFMTGVPGIPFGCFRGFIPVTTTGRKAKNMITEHGEFYPQEECRYELYTANDVLILMDETLASQGVCAGSYLQAKPKVFNPVWGHIICYDMIK